jgi:zinc-ribbon domain
VPEPPADCTVCGASIPAGARFCPACGTPVASGETTRADTPTHEPEPAPANVQRSSTRWFGLTPPTLVLIVAVLLFVLAVALLVLGRWVAGLLVLGLALLFAAAFLEAGRRKPDTAVARSSVGAVETLRARAAFAAQSLRARSSAHQEVARRRTEAMQLAGERERALRALGAAVYRGEDGTAERARLQQLDERLAELEREVGAIAAQTRNRVEEARLEVERTEVVRPPDQD